MFLFTINPDHVRRQTLLMPSESAPHVVRQAYLARSVIGTLQAGDIGKRVYSVRGVVQVENAEQRSSRLDTRAYSVRDPVPLVRARDGRIKLKCSERREGTERVCHCGVRWDSGDDKPECPHGGSY